MEKCSSFVTESHSIYYGTRGKSTVADLQMPVNWVFYNADFNTMAMLRFLKLLFPFVN